MTLIDTPLETLRLTSPEPGLLVIELNRPQAANAFNTAMAGELLRVFAALEADPGAYRCAVLTGAGERAFCSGADLKERDGMTDEDYERQHYLYERMIRQIIECPIPLIGLVNGAAIAGGLELALACDFIVASDTARFGFTEVTRGIMPGAGGTQQLPRAIGVRQAKELIFTGEVFDANEALRLGLVNRVHPLPQLRDAGMALVRRILANAPIAVRQVKKAISHGAQMDLRSALFFEIEAYSRVIGTADRMEGIRAFNEKRPPRFSGR